MTNGDFGFTRQCPPVNRYGTLVRHDVGLYTAADGADTHRRRAQQRMPALAQSRRVIRFQSFHNARHFENGILAQLGRRAMRRFAVRFEFQPQTALVCRDNLQSRRLANDGQSCLESRLQAVRRISRPPKGRTPSEFMTASVFV